MEKLKLILFFLIAMKLDENDMIVGVEKCREDQDIILGTKYGKCIRTRGNKIQIFC